MATKKFYAVRKGRVPGIYSTWDECKAQVHGFAGAAYKKFEDLELAKAFMDVQEKEKPKDLSEGLHIYIDGSYQNSTGDFSYGLVGAMDGEEFEEYQRFSNEEYAKHRNVSGELFGAMRALEIAQEKNVNSLDLYYDYAGIEKWATGEWKTNTALTAKYQAFFKAIQGIDVHFHKIAAHTGEHYNERADRLAKKALQEEEIC